MPGARSPATASSWPSVSRTIRSSCSASSASPESARTTELAHVGDELADFVLREGGAEGRHARPPDGRAAVLDDVEEVLVGALTEAGAVGEVAGTDQEERGAPGAATVGAVTRGAELVEEAPAPRRAARRARGVEQRCEARRQDADSRDREDERQERPAPGAEDSTHGRGRVFTSDAT